MIYLKNTSIAVYPLYDSEWVLNFSTPSVIFRQFKLWAKRHDTRSINLGWVYSLTHETTAGFAWMVRGKYTFTKWLTRMRDIRKSSEIGFYQWKTYFFIVLKIFLGFRFYFAKF